MKSCFLWGFANMVVMSPYIFCHNFITKIEIICFRIIHACKSDIITSESLIWESANFESALILELCLFWELLSK